jgi:hypothetical protein
MKHRMRDNVISNYQWLFAKRSLYKEANVADSKVLSRNSLRMTEENHENTRCVYIAIRRSRSKWKAIHTLRYRATKKYGWKL